MDVILVNGAETGDRCPYCRKIPYHDPTKDIKSNSKWVYAFNRSGTGIITVVSVICEDCAKELVQKIEELNLKIK